MNHIGFLDGLRGLSILLVVLFHAWNITWLPQGPFEFITVNGYYGVPMFFFISGFCLFYPYSCGRAPTLRAFVVKRIAKIIPSYYLALLVLWLLAPTPTNGEDLGYHALCVHNLKPEYMFSISSVFWSLGIEMQFYVVFPLLAWALIRRPFEVGLALVASAYVYRSWAVAHHPDPFYLDQLPGFLDCFILGSLASLAMVRRPVTSPQLATGLALLGTGIILWFLHSIFVVRFDHPAVLKHHVWGRTLFSLALFLIAQGAGRALGFQRVLNWKWLAFLSWISYNLYLWHLAIMDLFFRRHWPLATADPHADLRYQLAFYASTIPLAVAWTWFLTRFFEQPLLRRIGRYAKPTSA